MGNIKRGLYNLLYNRLQFFDSIVSNFLKFLPDKLYLSLRYRCKMGQWINWDNPKTFSEKLQWLKVYNRKHEHTMMVDKYSVKKYVADLIGEEHVIPTLGVWDTTEDIQWDLLPDQFVLKCTHDSGSVVICRDKNTFNKRAAKAKLESAMNHNFFWIGREYPYKNVKPRIICEQLMKDDKSEDLVDYKFFCFNGLPKVLFYASERFTSKDKVAKFDFYDMDLNHLPIKSYGHENSAIPPSVSPENFSKMKDLCRILSNGYPHVRVDLYVINDKIYFGELTFHHDGGFVQLEPEEWNNTFGDWIELPINN